eukprot:766656-Hanusia_phi.AAC.2
MFPSTWRTPTPKAHHLPHPQIYNHLPHPPSRCFTSKPLRCRRQGMGDSSGSSRVSSFSSPSLLPSSPPSVSSHVAASSSSATTWPPYPSPGLPPGLPSLPGNPDFAHVFDPAVKAAASLLQPSLNPTALNPTDKPTRSISTDSCSSQLLDGGTSYDLSLFELKLISEDYGTFCHQLGVHQPEILGKDQKPAALQTGEPRGFLDWMVMLAADPGPMHIASPASSDSVGSMAFSCLDKEPPMAGAGAGEEDMRDHKTVSDGSNEHDEMFEHGEELEYGDDRDLEDEEQQVQESRPFVDPNEMNITALANRDEPGDEQQRGTPVETWGQLSARHDSCTEAAEGKTSSRQTERVRHDEERGSDAITATSAIIDNAEKESVFHEEGPISFLGNLKVRVCGLTQTCSCSSRSAGRPLRTRRMLPSPQNLLLIENLPSPGPRPRMPVEVVPVAVASRVVAGLLQLQWRIFQDKLFQEMTK